MYPVSDVFLRVVRIVPSSITACFIGLSATRYGTFEYPIVSLYIWKQERTVSRMREKKTHIYVDSQEKNIAFT